MAKARNPWTSTKSESAKKPTAKEKLKEVNIGNIPFVVEICPSCGINQATNPHTCPYREDIAGDYDTLCTCCEECEQQCLMDI